MPVGSRAEPVLVLGDDTRAFLSVVRSLGRGGLQVHVAWCPLDSPALKSRYIRRFHQLREYRSDDPGWLSALNELLRKQRFEWIVPCTDGTILPLQLHRESLEDAGRAYLLPDAVYHTCRSKDETYRLAVRVGAPVPAQIEATTAEEVRNAAARFGLPLVLKPRTSSTAANPLSRQAVQKVRRPEDLDRMAHAAVAHGPVLVQQNVAGKGVGVEVLCRNGEVLAAFQHERVHEPLDGGGSSYRKSVPLHPGMLDVTRRLMAELRYTGVAMVEFKFDPGTGAWTLIEINARFWGSLPLSIAAGMDFPWFLYEMMLRGRTDFPNRYRLNLYCRNWSADLRWMLNNAAADRGEPDLMTAPLPKVAAEAMNIALLRERSDTFVLDDPRPALADLAGFFGKMAFAVKKRLKPLRVLESRRALRAFRNARKILFVCHGNICRSPFAATLLAQTDSRIEASSSGCFPKARRRSPEAAIQAARLFGVELADHRSNVLDREQVDSADAIFVFDRQNIDSLKERFPLVQRKTYLLAALDPSGPLEIEDPYGASPDDFMRCYQRIASILRAAAGAPRSEPAVAANRG